MAFSVGAVSAPDISARALVRGLRQLAPDKRMTCGAAMYHVFTATKLSLIASAAVGDRGRFSVVQGQVEPQLLQWLHTGPY